MNQTISVIMPAYNEESNLESAVLRTSNALAELVQDYEILIIDDCSKDKTGAIADQLAKDNHKIRVIHNRKNKGFGGSQKIGLGVAKNDLITLIPTDNQFDPKDLETYFFFINSSDIVVGCRTNRLDPVNRTITSKMYNLGLNTLFNLRIKDVDWVKLYRREVIDNVRIDSESAFIDAEILVRARKKGYRIKQIPVIHYPRTSGKASGNALKVVVKQLKELFLFWFRFHFKK
jgi:glycosyltransferase involved in cell wall biosynthesis